ncbi:hypothetical protein VKT23_008483 [Stygiomarasmius scandens]|uniref:Uncharacterized protein n=1 Tax=Marasmiellus scandens TaxID=2682957 RepID=A0ABR1JMN7_9AGAR
MARSLSAEEFFSTWQHALQSDFIKDGQSATYFPGHPKQWGDEIACIDFEGTIALNDDGSLLGISNLNGEARIYDVPSFTLWRTLKGPRSTRSGRPIHFQPGRGKVLVGGDLIMQGHRIRHWIKCHELKEVEEADDPFKEAANAAASVAVENILEKGVCSREDINRFKIHDSFHDMLSLIQLEMWKSDMFEGSFVSGRTFSRDGSFFLYRNTKNAIVVLDSESLQERYILAGHTDHIAWAETSPDDTVIATSSWDQTVRIWDAVNGQQLRILTGATSQLWSGAFSPDGKLVCVGCGGEDPKVRLWEVESGELLHELGRFRRWTRALAFSPDGRSIAAGSGNGVLKVFDAVSGKEKQHWQVKCLDPLASGFIEIQSVRYTSKGLLVFNYTDGRVYTYNEEMNKKGQYEYGPEIQLSAGYGAKLVSPDGRLLISADFDRRVRVWSLE